MQAIGMNHAAAELDSVTGLINFTPRMQVPDLPKAPIIYNNIKVDNSVIGAINTANVQTIDVSLSVLNQAGHSQASEALKALTEAVLKEELLDEVLKHEILDQVAFLSEQAIAPAQQRKPGLIKATLASLTLTANAVAAVAAAWPTLQPILKGIFGI